MYCKYSYILGPYVALRLKVCMCVCTCTRYVQCRQMYGLRYEGGVKIQDTDPQNRLFWHAISRHPKMRHKPRRCMAATGSMGTPVGAFRWHMSTTIGAADWCPSAPLTAALRPRLASKNGASDKIRKNCAGVRKNAPTCALPMELGVCGVAYWVPGTNMRDRACLLVLGKVPRRRRI